MNLVQVKRLAAWYGTKIERSTNTDLIYLRAFCIRLQELPAEKTEKAMRWLGFIQGALWANCVYPIAALKEHSRAVIEDREIA